MEPVVKQQRSRSKDLKGFYQEEDCGYATFCWVWQRALTNGYGHVSRGGRHYRAHRYLYEQRNGPIPDGLELDHLCQVKACVNPDHMEAVTHAENVRRGGSQRITSGQIAAACLFAHLPSEMVGPLFGVSGRTIRQRRRETSA